jgi:hypothetical protein
MWWHKFIKEKVMRIIKARFENGYVGCGEENCYVLDNLSDDQVDGAIYPDFDQYCEDYAYVADGYPWESVEDGDFMDEEDMELSRESYYENCSWEWEEIDAAELENWCEENGVDFDAYYRDAIAAKIANFN